MAEEELVERLRVWGGDEPPAPKNGLLRQDCREAADLIERLTRTPYEVGRFLQIMDLTDDEGFTPAIEQELMDLAASLRSNHSKED